MFSRNQGGRRATVASDLHELISHPCSSDSPAESIARLFPDLFTQTYFSLSFFVGQSCPMILSLLRHCLAFRGMPTCRKVQTYSISALGVDARVCPCQIRTHMTPCESGSTAPADTVAHRPSASPDLFILSGPTPFQPSTHPGNVSGAQATVHHLHPSAGFGKSAGRGHG